MPAPRVSSAVVVTHEPPKDFTPAGELIGPGLLILKDLAFERGVERLGHRIVGAGAHRSHGLGHAEFSAQVGVGLAGVDRAVIGVKDRSRQRPSRLLCRLQGIGNEIGAHMIGHRPPPVNRRE